MTQYEIDILSKDLYARLPYSVKGQYLNSNDPLLKAVTISYGSLSKSNGMIMEGSLVPWLFPLSSMTKEQRVELYKALGLGYESHYHLSKEWENFNNSINNNDLFLPASWVSDLNKMYDYLNKNHFDYRGLIPMGLANDATDKNIY